MMIPHFDISGRNEMGGGSDLADAAREVGCFYVRHPLFPEARCAEAISAAQAFFRLDSDIKRRLAIEGSRHWRGYSEMRSDRDWREQIHFGREEPAVNSDNAYDQLRGPNMWPASAEWRGCVLRLLADLEEAGRDILGALALTLGLPVDRFLKEDEDPYVLMKLIHYPVPAVPRFGVAAHVDFSWITLLLQDKTGGLEVCTPGGEWMEAAPVPGALFVNFGEILQFATRGHYAATPHRVGNRQRSTSRFSIPFFLNPALATRVEQVDLPAGVDRRPAGDHIHRVFNGRETSPFVFGEAEWRRKALGVWCGACAGGAAADATYSV
jgi:isopenicillin N synthase-like dioxygenase